MNSLATIDWVVLIAYFACIMSIGAYFWTRNRSSDQFTSGGRSLPGWVCGLSIFATYVSSISYLALPGKSFAADWNPFVFSLALPFATWIAVRYFLPYYRNSGEVSAYAMLEHRFGVWARIYASAFYLLYHIVRIGVVMYLMALPISIIFGWDMRSLILATGLAVTVYAFMGGLLAVIWSDAIQAMVLMVGAVVCLFWILSSLPNGFHQVVEMAKPDDKFSLGSFHINTISAPTFWVVLLFGVMENIKNFGIDQSYIQRYIASSDDTAAKRSVWLGGLLYIPVSALFFFIGTSLFALYSTNPDNLMEVRQIVAAQKIQQEGLSFPEGTPRTIGSHDVSRKSKIWRERVDEIAGALTDADIGDRVFPHFIATHLPFGIKGLLIAAILSAAMSTVSTSINSSATLVMSDFYQRFFRPDASDSQLMTVLRIATILWGGMGTVVALILVRQSANALDMWWTLSSVLGSGIVGLFLLGILSRVSQRSAIVAVLLGLAVVAWMVTSNAGLWPRSLEAYKSPFHNFLVIVVGAWTIVVTGVVAQALIAKSKNGRHE